MNSIARLMPSELAGNIALLKNNVTSLLEIAVVKTGESARRFWKGLSAVSQQILTNKLPLLALSSSLLPACQAYRLDTSNLDESAWQAFLRRLLALQLPGAKVLSRAARSSMEQAVKCIIGRAECYAAKLTPYVLDLGLRSFYSNVLASIYKQFPNDCKKFLQAAKDYGQGLYDLIDAHREIISPTCDTPSESSISPSALSTTTSSPSAADGLGFTQLVLYPLAFGFMMVGVYSTVRVTWNHKEAISSRVTQYASTGAESIAQAWHNIQNRCRGEVPVADLDPLVSDEGEERENAAVANSEAAESGTRDNIIDI